MTARDLRWTQEQLDAYNAQRCTESLDALGYPLPGAESKAVAEERSLQHACEAWLTERGLWWHHDRDRRGEVAGVPDLLICYSGLFIAVELKSKTGKVKPEQRDMMSAIRKSGGRTFVSRSLEEFIGKLLGGTNETRPL